MKQTYEKPSAAIEYYTLSQTISACNNKIGFMDSDCVLKDPDATEKAKDLAHNGWFMSGYCEDYSVGNEGDDGICYHTNANAMFSS